MTFIASNKSSTRLKNAFFSSLYIHKTVDNTNQAFSLFVLDLFYFNR